MAKFESGLAKLFRKYMECGASFDECNFTDSEDESESKVRQRIFLFNIKSLNKVWIFLVNNNKDIHVPSATFIACSFGIKVIL